MTIYVLSVDGGGIRGVGAAYILGQLEAKVGSPLHGQFDLVVGTSTGAIIAAGIAALKKTLSDIQQMYLKEGRNMFVSSWWGYLTRGLLAAKYSTQAKGRTLQRLLGDMRLGDVPGNLLVPIYDIGSDPGPKFINGGAAYRGKREPDDHYHEWPLWQVVNASSSAPMYFDPAPITVPGQTVRGADGGLFANNPAMCAFVEAQHLFDTEDIVVISVGTGQSRLSYPRQSQWGLVQWGSPFDQVPLLEAMFDGQSSTVSHQLAQLIDKRFYRFEFNLPEHPMIAMDDARVENQQAIMAIAAAYLNQPDVAKRLDEAAALLRGS